MENIFIHETATVDQGARIGFGTKIWHYVHVSERSNIGDDVSLGQNVFIANNVNIGNRCKIQNNVSIYDGVNLEEDVFCGPSMVFTNVFNPRSFIERKDEYRKTLVKKGATIGANATIVCGSKIGRYSFIGAGALINRDVKDFALIVGVPGKQIGWMSKSGNRIPLPVEGSGKYVCDHTGEVYILEDSEMRLENDGN